MPDVLAWWYICFWCGRRRETKDTLKQSADVINFNNDAEVYFDEINQLPVHHFTFVWYWRKITAEWDSTSAVFKF
jgi:hypothetical protein